MKPIEIAKHSAIVVTCPACNRQFATYPTVFLIEQSQDSALSTESQYGVFGKSWTIYDESTEASWEASQWLCLLLAECRNSACSSMLCWTQYLLLYDPFEQNTYSVLDVDHRGPQSWLLPECTVPYSIPSSLDQNVTQDLKDGYRILELSPTAAVLMLSRALERYLRIQLYASSPDNTEPKLDNLIKLAARTKPFDTFGTIGRLQLIRLARNSAAHGNMRPLNDEYDHFTLEQAKTVASVIDKFFHEAEVEQAQFKALQSALADQKKPKS